MPDLEEVPIQANVTYRDGRKGTVSTTIKVREVERNNQKTEGSKICNDSVHQSRLKSKYSLVCKRRVNRGDLELKSITYEALEDVDNLGR